MSNPQQKGREDAGQCGEKRKRVQWVEGQEMGVEMSRWKSLEVDT